MTRAATVAAVSVGLLLSAAALLYVNSGTLLSRWATELLLDQQLDHVVVEVGRPTLTGLDIPLFAAQRRQDGHRVTVTIENAHIDYTFASVMAGRVERIVLPQASIHLAEQSHAPLPKQEGVDAQPAASEWLAPLPLLPFDELAIGWVAIDREAADGVVHHGTVSGTLRTREQRVNASLTVQVAETPPYRVELDAAHLGDLAFDVTTTATPPTPVVSIYSTAKPSGSSDAQLALQGTLRADLQACAPLAAMVLPLNGNAMAIQGIVTVEWNGTASARAPLSALVSHPDTVLDGTYRVVASAPSWHRQATAIAGELSGSWSVKAQQLQWTLAKGARAAATVDAVVLGVPDGWLPATQTTIPLALLTTGELRGEVDQVFGQTAAKPTGFFNGPVTIRAGSPVGLSASIDLASLGLADGTLWGQGAVRLSGTPGKVVTAAVGAERATVDLRADVSIAALGPTGTASPIRLDVKPGSTIEAAPLVIDSIRSARATVRVTKSMVVRLPQGAAASPTTIDSGAVELTAPLVTFASGQVAFERTTIDVTRIVFGASTTGGATIRLVGMRPTLNGMTLAQGDWTVTGRAEATQYHTDVDGRIGGTRAFVTGRFAHDLRTATGAASLTLKPVRSDVAQPLSTLLSPWPLPVDVTAGTLAADAQATTTGATLQSIVPQRAQLTVRTDAVATTVAGLAVTGITTAATLLYDGGRLAMPQPAALRIAAIDAGVKANDLSASWQLGWGDGFTPVWADVRKLSLRAFGGTVGSDGLRYMMHGASKPFSLTLRELQLQEIFQLEQQKGLDGTGVLNGVIPITLGEVGVTVENGEIEARPPGGIIRYRPNDGSAEAMAQSSSAMQTVLQPLANFHYNVLRATAQYEPKGTLSLATRLEGRNPDWQRGRPVHFNVTVTENIPALLKSLGLVQSLQDSIEQRFDNGARSLVGGASTK
ncbi:MAG: YdbH domain-containing protein [Nitrospiraceae bacterium]